MPCKKSAKTVHMAYFLVQRLGPTQERLNPNLSFNSNQKCNNIHHEKVCNQNCNQWDSLDLKRRQVVPLPPDRPSPSWWFPSQQIYEYKHNTSNLSEYKQIQANVSSPPPLDDFQVSKYMNISILLATRANVSSPPPSSGWFPSIDISKYYLI